MINKNIGVYVKHFNDITKFDVNIAGGKGASLGEMTRAGIPVPEGFVVLSHSFDEFITFSKLDDKIAFVLSKVDINVSESVDDASKKIQSMILKSQMPRVIAREIMDFHKQLNAKHVAVRSSATSEDSASAAWAGQLDSFLNTTQDKVLDNVRKCWASLFTPRAIFYRIEKELHNQKVSVAVVVQKMVHSDVSGIAFSVHPVSQDRNHIIIEAGYGLGEAIVSGQITPDSYIVHKKSLEHLEKNVNMQTRMLVRSTYGGNEWKDVDGREQKLHDDKIIELARLIVKIENHYKFPCDIEWAMEDNKLYIVQSRPITTLSDITIDAVDANNGIVRKLDTRPDVFPRDLINNVLPFCTRPMTVQRDIMGSVMFWKLGKSRFISLPLDKKNRALFVESTGRDKAYQQLADMVNTRKKWTDHLNEYSRISKELINISLQLKKGNNQLKDYQAYMDKIYEYSTFLAMPFAIEEVIDPTLRKKVNSEIVNALAAPDKLDDYKKMRLDIIEAKLTKKYTPQQLADKYGWYGEYSYVEPLLDAKHFEDILSKMSTTDAKKEQEEILSTIIHNKKSATDALKKIKDKDAHLMAEVIHAYSYIRTERLDILKQSQVNVRSFFHRLANEIGWDYKLITFLTSKEITNYLKTKTLPSEQEMQKRLNHEYILYYDGEAHIVYDNVKEITDAVNKNFESNEIKGLASYKGVVSGRVKIVLSKQDLAKVLDGDVLVAKTTMPDYTLAMRKSAAIVTDDGGITSHAAIISREMKKPCVVGTQNATKILKDGDYVEVDADNGIVKILK